MLKIFLFVFVTVLVSTSYGILLNQRFDFKKNDFVAPIGFAGLMMTLQLLYYPVQLFNLHSHFLHVFTAIVYVVLLVFAFKNRKQMIEEYFSTKSLWIIASFVLFILVFYRLSVALDFADTQMYTNYICQSINAGNVNLYNIWTGELGAEWDSIYLFQGFYHYISVACYFVNFFNYAFGIGGFVENMPIIVWGFGMIYSLISSMALYNFVQYFPFKKHVKTIVLIFTLFFTNFYYWRVAFAFYGNTFRTLYISMLMFFLYRRYKENQPNFKWLCVIFMGAGMAFSSSYLFVSFSVMYGLMVYVFKTQKSGSISEMADYVIPLLIYAVAKFSKDAFPLAIVGGGIAILYYATRRSEQVIQITNKIEAFLQKYCIHIFVIGVGVVGIIYSTWLYFVGNPTYPYNFFHYFNNHRNYDMVKDYYFIYSSLGDNLLNALRWIAIAILLTQKTDNQGQRYFKLLVIIMFFVFLNPFSTAFISDTIASNVYYRSFEVVFNPFTETLLLYLLYNKFADKKFVEVLVSVVLIFNVFYGHIESIRNTEAGLYSFYMEEGKTVDPIFKLYPGDYEILKEFRGVVEETEQNREDQLVVISHAEGLRTFLPEVHQLFTARQYHYPWDRVDQEFYEQARRHYSWMTFDKIDYSSVCDHVKEFGVDYAIIKYWENWEFDNATAGCMVTISETAEFKIKKTIE